jgi:hypothetical protein
MNDLRVESYNANEVEAKKQLISKRVAVAGSAAALTLGLFNLAGCVEDVEEQNPHALEEPPAYVEEEEVLDVEEEEALDVEEEEALDVEEEEAPDVEEEEAPDVEEEEALDVEEEEALDVEEEEIFNVEEEVLNVEEDWYDWDLIDDHPGGSGSWFVSVLERI